MNLGFDLDKIFIDYPPFIPPEIINRLYKEKSDGLLAYRMPKKPEQILRIISHYHLFRAPISKNLEFVKKLKKRQNHKHFLISSRFSFLKKTTELVVKKNKLNELFDKLYFNFNDLQPHLFKNEIIRKLKIQRYVDDDLFLLKFVAAKNQKSLFFWLNNKVKKRLNKNIIAITDLSEMLK